MDVNHPLGSALAGLIHDAVLLRDRSGRIIDVNAGLCEMTGLGRDELAGAAPPFAFWPESDFRDFQNAWRDGQENISDFGSVFTRKNGERFPVLVRATTVRESGQTLIAVRDMTELYRARDQVTAVEDRFQLAAEAMTGVVFDWDVESGGIQRSPGLGDLLGYLPDEADPTHPWWVKRIHPEDFPAFSATLEGAIRNQAQRLHRIEYRVLHKDGTYRWILSRALTLRDGRGQVRRIIGVHTDVDERRKAHEALRAARDAAEAANKAKDEFLAVLSHELRTPLTPVLLTVSLIESRPDLPSDLREDVGSIRRNVELEGRLIGDLLDLTRVARGKLQLDFQQVDLNVLIRSAVDICQREDSAKLTVDLNATRHHVRADGTRIQQVFWNLINNAQKFTPKDGSILVRSSDGPEGQVCVEIRDTGVGIEPEVLPKLFTAFEQGEIRAQRQFAGLGLGLAISRTLVEAHGGTIGAHSAGKGRGTVFSVMLPTCRVGASPVLPEQQPAGAGRALQVLLVEDHEPTLRIMTRVLNQMGHTVAGVTSLASATAAARHREFDLLVSDLGLPDGSGLELMRQLKERYAGKAIALTGYGMEDDVRNSLSAGFAAHLTKPIDLHRLEETIRQVTESIPVQPQPS